MKSFKRYITEEWFDTVKNRNNKNDQTDIFKNPSNTDFKGISSFRWVAFPESKNLYMAQAELLHDDLARACYQKGEKGIRLSGQGSYIKNKASYDISVEDILYPTDDGYHMDNYYLGVKFYDYDWKFMDKWIPNFSTMYNDEKDEVIKAYNKYQEE